MICRVIQQRAGSRLEWLVEQDGTALCKAVAPFERGRFNIHVEFANGEKYRMYFNPSDKQYGASMTARFSFKLLQDEQLISLVNAPNKMLKGWFKSYQYRVVNFKGTPYYLYEVGFGYKGLYLCIYREEELIAVVQKDLVVRNFLDTYTIYGLDEKDLPMMMPLLLHYDTMANGDITQMAVSSVKVTTRNTIQPELIAKYDPEFIPRIKAMHGIK